MRKLALASLLAAAACTQVPQEETPSLPENGAISPEVLAEFEALQEVVPALFANTTLVAATRLEFDGAGSIDNGEVVAHLENFDCANADATIEGIARRLQENPDAEVNERIFAFIHSLSVNNAAIIKDMTESGIHYEFRVDCEL